MRSVTLARTQAFEFALTDVAVEVLEQLLDDAVAEEEDLVEGVGVPLLSLLELEGDAAQLIRPPLVDVLEHRWQATLGHVVDRERQRDA